MSNANFKSWLYYNYRLTRYSAMLQDVLNALPDSVISYTTNSSRSDIVIKHKPDNHQAISSIMSQYGYKVMFENSMLGEIIGPATSRYIR